MKKLDDAFTTLTRLAKHISENLDEAHEHFLENEIHDCLPLLSDSLKQSEVLNESLDKLRSIILSVKGFSV